jgi:hypothetical protein
MAMTLRIVALTLLTVASAPTYAQRDKRSDTGAVARACSVSECFMERDIRDFDVIDQTHVIVYTGQQRCAFHVELSGAFCDLTFAPELMFSRANGISDSLIQRGPTDPTGVSRSRGSDLFGRVDQGSRNLRICDNDLGIQVDSGGFSEPLGERADAGPTNPRRMGPTGELRRQADCRVVGVTSITDDQLLEFMVARGVLAPPPPMGAAEIEVGAQPEGANE